MGNHCCTASSPCSTVEERHVLLDDDCKQRAAAEVEGINAFQNSPDADDMKKIEQTAMVEKEEEESEAKPCATQNGPSLQEPRPSTPSSSREVDLTGNAGAQDPEDGKKTNCHCTLAPPLLQPPPPPPQPISAARDAIATTQMEGPVMAEEEVPAAVTQMGEVALEDIPAAGPEAGGKLERVTLLASSDGDEWKTPSVLAITAAELADNSSPPLPISDVSEAALLELSTTKVDQEGEEAAPICSAPKEAAPRRGSSTAREEEEAPKDTTRDAAATTATSDKSEHPCSVEVDTSVEPKQSAKPESESAAVTATAPATQAPTGEPEQDEDVPEPKGTDEEGEKEVSPNDCVAEEEVPSKEPGQESGTPTRATAETEATVRESEDSAEEGSFNSEEDLYRGAEELSPTPETPQPKAEDRCSLDAAVDILSYSEREWRGKTAKSALIRKGYRAMSEKFSRLRRVRGDNYCALRATLFQLLSHSTRLPAPLQDQDPATLPKELEACEELISQWTFPGEGPRGDGTGDAALQLRGYVKLLRDTWQEAAGCSSPAERQQLCERVFCGGEEELGLLEALKLLMLGQAVELHGRMQAGGDVPLFCWLLFARDSSACPRSFLSNHLSRVGLSAGLEQVEMFLLGYALQCTIQVYRLYMADTEEFVTFYPDDHKDDWPCISLVTEDDRHYNVPVDKVSS